MLFGGRGEVVISLDPSRVKSFGNLWLWAPPTSPRNPTFLPP